MDDTNEEGAATPKQLETKMNDDDDDDDIESGRKSEDVVGDNRQNDTIAAEILTASLLKKNILPNRPAQDIARDKKRILEICYGNDASLSPPESPKSVAQGDDEDRGKELRQEKMQQAKEKKQEQQAEKGDNQQPEAKEVDSQSKDNEEKKKKNKKKKRAKGNHEEQAKEKEGEAQQSEVEAVESQSKDNKDENTKKKKKKKKDGDGKKKTKKSKAPIRDSSGKIKRRKLKIKGRSRVVKKNIKRGKDAKIDLPPIDEADSDSDIDEGEVLPDSSLGNANEDEEHRIKEQETGSIENESESSEEMQKKQPFWGGYKCIAFMTSLVLIGAGAGVVFAFLFFKESGPKSTASPTISPAPTITASPTVTPAPTPVPRFEYLSALLTPISPNIGWPLSDQETAMIWMISRDPSDWSQQTDAQLIERYIIVLIYFATEGDLWDTNFEWLSGLTVCDWYGVVCNVDGFVSDLVLGKYK